MTETNTFSSAPTQLHDFDRSAGAGNDEPWSYRLEPLRKNGVATIGGFTALAEPGGIVGRHTYEALRDELLQGIREALPLDFVVLLLHGAMVANGYDDCEGDILSRVRGVVGNDALLGATLDPHAHLSEEMLRNATLLIAYKEYPHIDAEERVRELSETLVRIKRSRTLPAWAYHDCRMISLFHTNRQPMRGFVDRILDLEHSPGTHSISLIHGFPWGDVPQMGTKVLVYADNRLQATRLATRLGTELFDLRGRTYVPPDPLVSVVESAMHAPVPAIIADFADNPGGGAPGDSTFVLRALLQVGARDVAFGPICDPSAVVLATKAGIGNAVSLLIGGSSDSQLSGEPLAATGTVTALADDYHTPVFGGPESDAGYGSVAAIRLSSDVDIVLTSTRSQVFSRSFFEALGIDLSTKRIIGVKSSHHFHHDFGKIAGSVFYAASPGALNTDFASIPYRRVPRPIWPLDGE